MESSLGDIIVRYRILIEIRILKVYLSNCEREQILLVEVARSGINNNIIEKELNHIIIFKLFSDLEMLQSQKVLLPML